MKSTNVGRKAPTLLLGKLAVIFMLLFLFNIVSCTTTVYTRVYRVYYQAMVYPEEFDSYVQSNMSDFDDRFFSCMQEARGRIAEIVAERSEICDQHADPEWRQACYDEIDEVAIGINLHDIESVIKEGIPFMDTPTGFALLLIKELIGQEDFEDLQKSIMPVFEDYFRCEKKKFLGCITM